MPVTAIFHVPDMSTRQYDQIMRDLDAAGAGAPDGRLYHVCNANGAGCVVVDIWSSPEKLERFAETLFPILAKNGVTPPRPEVLTAHNEVLGGR